MIPPIRKLHRNPNTHSIGTPNRIRPSQIVPTADRKTMPVGTEISSVVTMIGMWKNSAMPLTNMWWAQTMKLSSPMETKDSTARR